MSLITKSPSQLSISEGSSAAHGNRSVDRASSPDTRRKLSPPPPPNLAGTSASPESHHPTTVNIESFTAANGDFSEMCPPASSDFASPVATSIPDGDTHDPSPYKGRRSFKSTPPPSRIAKAAVRQAEPVENPANVLNPSPTAIHSPEEEAPAQKTNPATVDPPREGPLPQGYSPSLGAWNKKLSFPSAPLIPRSMDKRMWPSLGASKSTTREPRVSQKPVSMEDDIRFPWAARMNPSSRNLYRATEPEFLEDGTPKVTIPQHVLVQGIENQKEYVLGQFYRCSSPPGGLIFAVFNHLWGRTCKITIRKLGDCSYLFHIPDESTRTWVLQRGLWHVDDCLMFVAPWSPEPSLAIPEIKTIPVWVTLKKIPIILYSISGISHIASGLGAPMATHKPRLDPIFTGEAKILVEVELSKAFPPRIAATDKSEFICMVDVEYAWLPSKCARCGELGHKVKRCLQTGIDSSVVVNTTTKASTSEEDSLSDSVQLASVPASVTEVPPCDPITIAPNTAIVSPTQSITIEKAIESPNLGAARPLSITKATTAQEQLTVHMARESLIEPDLGSNKFASLGSPVEEEDPSDSDKESDQTDFMTPAGRRILRDRPVKPTIKAKEMHWQSMARGRGSRGRGGRS